MRYAFIYGNLWGGLFLWVSRNKMKCSLCNVLHIYYNHSIKTVSSVIYSPHSYYYPQDNIYTYPRQSCLLWDTAWAKRAILGPFKFWRLRFSRHFPAKNLVPKHYPGAKQANYDCKINSRAFNGRKEVAAGRIWSNQVRDLSLVIRYKISWHSRNIHVWRLRFTPRRLLLAFFSWD